MKKVDNPNSKSKKSQNKSTLPQDRIYERFFKNNQYNRRVIIQINFIQVHDPKKKQTQIFRNSNQEKNLLFQYQFQSQIQSQFLIKNIGRKVNNAYQVWLQQDFDCFLSELSIENLSFQKRFRIFQCIAQGVQDLKKNKICHRSLSPSCISIIKSGQIFAKINCFQNCAILQHEKSFISSTHMSINQFSSPQLTNLNCSGFASDIWSLGCLLNYLLYETLKNIWTVDKQTKIQVPPEGTPDWLLQLLKSMLHFDISKRCQISAVLQIIKVSNKCIKILQKTVPTGKTTLKLNKKDSKLKFQLHET